MNLTTLAPGSWSAHRHWHDNEDEFVFVVEGEITLIDDAGEHVLKSGMCAGFKAGVANGHHLVNKTKTPVTYLEIGTRAPREQAHYSDVDMLYVRDGKTITVHGNRASRFSLFSISGALGKRALRSRSVTLMWFGVYCSRHRGR